MPHVVVKLFSGRSEDMKQRLAGELTKAVMSAIGSSEDSISVSVIDVDPADWTEKVYKPEIVGKPETIYKQPGYNPL